METKRYIPLPRILMRVARILGILFAGFISMFALDVFETGVPFGQVVLALVMHLIPTILLLVLLWIAWKYPLPGGILFILAGASYIFWAHGQIFSTYLIVAGIPILTGVLFLLGYALEKRAGL
jgi:hypothetical protein